MNCMFHEQGVISPDGKVDLIKFHDIFSEHHEIHFIFAHMVRKCLHPEGDDACQRAYDLHRCWKQSEPTVK